MMNRMPNAADLTSEEFVSLTRVCRGFICATIPKAHQARLVELGLIQAMMGGLIITPMGRMVARA
jgi:hypothetical protein